MATTSTAPNLYQLGQEIGGSPSFRMSGPYEDGSYRVVSPEVPEPALQAALDAHHPNPAIVPPPTPAEQQATAEDGFIAARVPAVLAKARAIVADPTGAPDFTVAERKVLNAVLLLDLARRR